MAKAIEFTDKFENMGAQMVKEVATLTCEHSRSSPRLADLSSGRSGRELNDREVLAKATLGNETLHRNT
ncbi:MAG: hypothetical protein ACM3O6_16530 [Acidobacteriota bacterium]